MGGIYIGVKKAEDGSLYIGCWKKVAESNRAITMRVEKLAIGEILDTTRHEICHEIHYRLNKETYKDIPNEEQEKFAEECDPDDYLRVK